MGFVELHIEQGPLLERAQTSLGIVMRIAAPASLRISIEGAGGHAGGVLMPDRKDAALRGRRADSRHRKRSAFERRARHRCHGRRLRSFSGAVNSIPSRVHLTLDIRDTIKHGAMA